VQIGSQNKIQIDGATNLIDLLYNHKEYQIANCIMQQETKCKTKTQGHMYLAVTCLWLA